MVVDYDYVINAIFLEATRYLAGTEQLDSSLIAETRNLASKLRIIERGNAWDYWKYKNIIDPQYAGYILKAIKKILHTKIVLVVANCQGELIYQLLIDNVNIKSKYFFFVIPPLPDLVNNVPEELGVEIFGQVDLFLYQTVKEEGLYSKWNSKKLISWLSGDAEKICIPNLYFNGYFPNISRKNGGGGRMLNS